MAMNWEEVSLSDPLDPEIFGNTARKADEHVASGKGNEATQLRKFYDEFILWFERVETEPERLTEYLPFIRMIKAKVAYAQARSVVDDRYVGMIERLVDQIDGKDPKTLKRAKTFLEAFTGYYKGLKASDQNR